MILRNKAYKVLLKSGKLTKEVITGLAREVGSLVKDSKGRLFRVLETTEIEYHGLPLTRLWDKEGN